MPNPATLTKPQSLRFDLMPQDYTQLRSYLAGWGQQKVVFTFLVQWLIEIGHNDATGQFPGAISRAQLTMGEIIELGERIRKGEL